MNLVQLTLDSALITTVATLTTCFCALVILATIIIIKRILNYDRYKNTNKSV